MTIDEAIKHCLEVAEQKETQAEKWQEEGGEEWGKTTACRECAIEQRQLAECLKEAEQLLKSAAKIAKNLPCDDGNCSECVHNDNGHVCSEYEYFEWQYADEALKLIGGSENET